jgi:hypothetical protein
LFFSFPLFFFCFRFIFLFSLHFFFFVFILFFFVFALFFFFIYLFFTFYKNTSSLQETNNFLALCKNTNLTLQTSDTCKTTDISGNFYISKNKRKFSQVFERFHYSLTFFVFLFFFFLFFFFFINLFYSGTLWEQNSPWHFTRKQPRLFRHFVNINLAFGNFEICIEIWGFLYFFYSVCLHFLFFCWFFLILFYLFLTSSTLHKKTTWLFQHFTRTPTLTFPVLCKKN